MPAYYTEVLARYHAGQIGRSVRAARLEGRPLREVHASLLRFGFHLVPDAIFVERTPQGAPQWLRMDGTATASRSDGNIVPVECYVHRDGGMVRVFPAGDPRGRVCFRDGPAAIKSVLFEPAAVGGDGKVEVDTSFRNAAFGVADDGKPIPKGRCAIFGMPSDPRSFVKSYLGAEEIARRGVIALRVQPE